MTNSIAEDNMCVKVYDPQHQKLIAVYENFQRASNKLGITSSIIHQKIARKTRAFSPTLNLEVAIRAASKKEGDDDLIIKTNKQGTI